ncbi:guanylyl cyclase [Phlyctochytrium arcticum]|nr:guanylyl cyclase [Phlyctochytrium arcticum]
MLPKHVADELKAGRTPEPTSFDLVSLFFTDIEGFKELANRSSPHQIVALLNRMYIAFDDVISTFPDLYKVETVMDSFMVCSGLSGGAKKKSREDKISDASVAADCALALLRAVGKIDMSDQLVDRVNLRIGIQCGPILAGVIGTKMPHYCLFGDTVNTASRMCSTSESLKLQISQDMYELLSDTYVCEARGTISVKGKGEMNTYYLTGKKGSR